MVIVVKTFHDMTKTFHNFFLIIVACGGLIAKKFLRNFEYAKRFVVPVISIKKCDVIAELVCKCTPYKVRIASACEVYYRVLAKDKFHPRKLELIHTHSVNIHQNGQNFVISYGIIFNNNKTTCYRLFKRRKYFLLQWKYLNN